MYSISKIQDLFGRIGRVSTIAGLRVSRHRRVHGVCCRGARELTTGVRGCWRRSCQGVGRLSRNSVHLVIAWGKHCRRSLRCPPAVCVWWLGLVALVWVHLDCTLSGDLIGWRGVPDCLAVPGRWLVVRRLGSSPGDWIRCRSNYRSRLGNTKLEYSLDSCFIHQRRRNLMS